MNLLAEAMKQAEINTEIVRLQESADYWRNRANYFELALRQVVAASERWDIAINALDKARGKELK